MIECCEIILDKFRERIVDKKSMAQKNCVDRECQNAGFAPACMLSLLRLLGKNCSNSSVHS
jgi:hypothetical protein